MSSLDNNTVISKTFNFNGNNNVRVLNLDGHIWFYGNDVAKCLGYKRPRKAIEDDVDNEDELSLLWRDSPQTVRSILWSKNDFRPKKIIDEPGVYNLIFSSKLPSAKKFKHWVTHDVLPSIRKTGSYSIKPHYKLPNYSQSLRMLANKIDENNLLIQKRQRDLPFTNIGKAFMHTKHTELIGQFAKTLFQAHLFKGGQNKLFAWMRYNNYLCHSGRNHNIPRQQYINCGWFKIRHSMKRTNFRSEICYLTTLITPKGQKHFINAFVYYNKRVYGNKYAF